MMSSRILATGDSLSDLGAATSARRPFPLRTLMVCFTVWLIATEVLIFDQIKFDAKAELLEQAARALRGPLRDVPRQRWQRRDRHGAALLPEGTRHAP